MKTYMARQPIFDSSMNVFGYELLYRSSTQNNFNGWIDGDHATRQVLSDTITTFGTENILNGKYAFVNFTYSLLVSDLINLLNPAEFVIEVLESVSAEPEILERLAEFRMRGFKIALDDYTGLPQRESLLEYVDIVKVDFKGIHCSQRAPLVQKLRKRNLQVLAEKVETQADFLEAKQCGYTLFQGYFFSKPVVFSKTVLSTSTATYARAIHEVLQPEADFAKVASIIRSDVTLTYRLLHHVNTLQFYSKSQITSVMPAVTRMGVNATYRWLMLVLMRDMTQLSNSEITRIALTRAIFCDKVCAFAQLPYHHDEAYIAGMFSVIDSMINQDFAEFMRDIALAPAVVAALIHDAGPLTDILDFTIAYESANWETVKATIEQYHLSDEDVIQAYRDAVRSADTLY